MSSTAGSEKSAPNKALVHTVLEGTNRGDETDSRWRTSRILPAIQPLDCNYSVPTRCASDT